MEKELTFIEVLELIDKDEVESLKELFSQIDAYTASMFLCYAAENNAINTLEFLLGVDGIMPELKDNYAIRIAASKGYDDCVRILAADDRVDETVLESEENVVKKNNVKTKEEVQKEVKEIFDGAILKLEADLIEEGIPEVEKEEVESEEIVEETDSQIEVEFVDLNE